MAPGSGRVAWSRAIRLRSESSSQAPSAQLYQGPCAARAAGDEGWPTQGPPPPTPSHTHTAVEALQPGASGQTGSSAQLEIPAWRAGLGQPRAGPWGCAGDFQRLMIRPSAGPKDTET